jgi:hypothetical protein
MPDMRDFRILECDERDKKQFINGGDSIGLTIFVVAATMIVSAPDAAW